MSKTHTYDYPLPAVTVDTVIFTIRRSKLMVLLIKRRDAPFKGAWAIPGGFVGVGVGHKSRGKQGEDLFEAAERELREETSLERERDDVFLEQLVGRMLGRQGLCDLLLEAHVLLDVLLGVLTRRRVDPLPEHERNVLLMRLLGLRGLLLRREAGSTRTADATNLANSWVRVIRPSRRAAQIRLAIRRLLRSWALR